MYLKDSSELRNTFLKFGSLGYLQGGTTGWEEGQRVNGCGMRSIYETNFQITYESQHN